MLSYMAVQFFRESPLLAYPLFALACFVSVYFAWVLKTALASAEHYDTLARLPLQDSARTRTTTHGTEQAP
jgi:hypothetical protein